MQGVTCSQMNFCPAVPLWHHYFVILELTKKSNEIEFPVSMQTSPDVKGYVFGMVEVIYLAIHYCPNATKFFEKIER